MAALLVCLSARVACAYGSSGETVPLQYQPQFILEVVARRLNVSLRPAVPMPVIHLASESSLVQFQNDIEPQWRMRPSAITTVYILASNEIYLNDHRHDLRFNRTLDDALAHEFVHFIQANYLGDREGAESGEEEAVTVQAWFRNNYLP